MNPSIPGNLNQNPALVNAFTKPFPVVVKEEPKQTTKPLAPSVETPLVPWDDVDIGVVVKVKGKVGKDWGQKRIEIIQIEVIRSTDHEVRCWNEVLAFRKDILRNPWVVSEEEEEQCRKLATREKQWKGAERKDKEAKTRKRSTEEGRGRQHEADEHRRKRRGKDTQNIEHKGKRLKDRDGEGLNPKNKINYPSLTVRRRAAGKYDALGI